MATNNAINLGKYTFSAYISSASISNPAGTVIFDSVFVNESSAYDTSTGIFTAPVAGNYLFSSFLNFGGLGAVTAALVAFNIDTYAYQWGEINPTNATDSYGYFSMQSTLIMPLTVGQQVKVATGFGGGAIRGSGAGYNVSNFSGCLLL